MQACVLLPPSISTSRFRRLLRAAQNSTFLSPMLTFDGCAPSSLGAHPIRRSCDYPVRRFNPRSFLHRTPNSNTLGYRGSDIALPRFDCLMSLPRASGYLTCIQLSKNKVPTFSRNTPLFFNNRSSRQTVECSSSPSGGDKEKVPFGYTRKDVLLIGAGLTVVGVGLKSGLEFVGVNSLQAGNVVQLVLVLGLTVGWISTYIFRVSNKDMTYAQQLRDYETKVMEKRLETLTEAETEALLEQVEEEKRLLANREQG